jgi:hypothetical protein
MRQTLVRYYYAAGIFILFFVHFNDLKCKNSKLENYRSH